VFGERFNEENMYLNMIADRIKKKQDEKEAKVAARNTRNKGDRYRTTATTNTRKDRGSMSTHEFTNEFGSLVDRSSLEKLRESGMSDVRLPSVAGSPSPRIGKKSLQYLQYQNRETRS